MSEKLDGVRAYWDGKQFLSRLGNPYLAPDWFMAGLPVDPARWRALGRPQAVPARRQHRSPAGQERALARDHVRGVRRARGRCAVRGATRTVPRAVCGSRDAARSSCTITRCAPVRMPLRAELARVEALGGEGLMLRQPGSRYVAGRSTTLLKVKSFFDAEATVIDHLPGEGRHEGRLGALLVERPDGIRFSVGTGFSDAERGVAAADRQPHHVPLPGAVDGRRAALPFVRRRPSRRATAGCSGQDRGWRDRCALQADSAHCPGRRRAGRGNGASRRVGGGNDLRRSAFRIRGRNVQQVLGSRGQRLRHDRSVRPHRDGGSEQDEVLRKRTRQRPARPRS